MTREVNTNDCMLFAGYKSPKGYAQVSIKIDGKWRSRPLHREVYLVEKGYIPEGYVMDHLCKNRSCVNSDHLEPVTNAVNISRGARPPVWGTHCNNGHPIYEGSYRLLKGNRRVCRLCSQIETKARYQRYKEAKAQGDKEAKY